MYVAVVYKHHEDTFPRSHKPQGDYSCFVGYTKEEAVGMAGIAVRQWEGVHPAPKFSEDHGTSKFYGPYQILVGELTQEAVVPLTLVPYKG